MKFTELNLKVEVLDWLAKLGYETPTKIQEEVILEYTNWKNIIWQSQTWTGKTAAFVISLLQSIDLTRPWVQALVMAPTRELVTQIREEFLAISWNMNIRSLPVYGGSPIFKQIDMLRKWQTIVIGTPGRIIDLIERKALKLSEVEYFVLDEVDRMLDMGFVDDIDFIWNSLTSVKQSLAFSATITPEIKSIVEKYLWVNYTFIKATSDLMVEKIDHSFMEVPHIDKYNKLKSYINKHKAKKAIVFVQTKRDTEEIASKLREDWFQADCLNWDMRQRERFKALRDFQDGVSKIFVVTDVAARWLNVKNIDLVVNFDVPNDPESYIHRIGRTWRAWADWKAIMFVAKNEQIALKNIERRNKISIKQVDDEWNEMARKSTRDEGSFNWGRNRFNSRSGGSSSRSGSRWGFGWRSSSGGWRFSEAPRWERIDKWERPSYFDSKPSSERSSFWDRDSRPRTSSSGGRFSEWRSEGGFKKPFGERSERPSHFDSKPSSERKPFWDRDSKPSRDFNDKPKFKKTGDSKRPYKKKD
ncbi:MAG: hypothetical protein ACD_4C00234G0007 [uncultured bacterium (gcode 4)]|uniref:ATP-dependent RNA helicase n=1 Tax=uncultured bacterium (gcode 4) TaxID=1234023 RepID=K2G8Z6_9BACT|nr:MAG: hypothetical protein ACD_4C00234G0007 [uncultured bacterium (gcode 4)]